MRSPRHRVAATICAVAASAAATAAAPPAQAEPRAASHAGTLKMIWGPTTLPDGRSAFTLYRLLGVDVFQIQLSWAAASPTRPGRPLDPGDPAYRWPSNLDFAVREAYRNGIAVTIQIRQTPPWANGGRTSEWAPSDPRTYAAFAHAAARRYHVVRHWMVWGEVERNLKPMSPDSPLGPMTYAAMLDWAYVALKLANRRNVVIGGMTFSGSAYTGSGITTQRFVDWMRLPSGRPPRLDYYGHNPFTVRFPDIRRRPYLPGDFDISDADSLAVLIWQTYAPYGRRPRLWLSEFTVGSDRPNWAFAHFVSRRAQARWLLAAYRIALRAPYVAGLGWYNLHDESPSIPNGLTMGLFQYNMRPKWAAFAYRRVP